MTLTPTVAGPGGFTPTGVLNLTTQPTPRPVRSKTVPKGVRPSMNRHERRRLFRQIAEAGRRK